MVRAKTYDATGVAPNGRLFAGDLNLLQDLAAALTDLAQNLSVGTIAVGESGLLISRFGAGEFSFTGLARFSGIVRTLAGLVSGTYTTTTRNAIALGSRPYGLIILNSTTNQYEWNKGTDAVPDWQPISPPISAGTITSTMILDGTIVDADLAADTLTARVIAADAVGASELANAAVDSAAIAAGAAAGGSNYGTVFPTTGLFNGYRFTIFLSNPAGGSNMYDTIYRADLDATYPWHCEGCALMHEVPNAENSVSSAVYSGIGTAGPSVTLARAGVWQTEHGSTAVEATGGATDNTYHSYDIGGTGAVDADAVQGAVSSGGTLGAFTGSRRRTKTISAAATALVSKYRGAGGTTVQFSNRFLAVWPIRLI